MKSRRILVVDGHPVMRDGLRAIVEQEVDMDVVGDAASGREAVQAFNDLRPDAVLLDMQIANPDVLQTILAIRAESADVALILMSTYSSDPRLRTALALGGNACVLKTATGGEILDEVRKAIAFTRMGEGPDRTDT